MSEQLARSSEGHVETIPEETRKKISGPNAISLGLTAADIANWKAAQAALGGS